MTSSVASYFEWVRARQLGATFFDAQTGTPANIEGSNTNSSITRVFTTAGTYHYTCHIHPFMEGSGVVTD